MKCPYCGALNDDATSLDDPPSFPEEGDFGVCLCCGGVVVYIDNNFNSRKITPEEELTLDDDIRTGIDTALSIVEMHPKYKS